jgi:hypothetical protein
VSTAYESADLLLKLYELRREPTMREARNWFVTFNPDSVDDLAATLRSEHSAQYRMVTSYWDMAASLVNHGAIDEQMFNAANAEHIIVFSKVEPFVEQYRTKMNSPMYLKQLEDLVLRLPNARQRLAATRERFRAFAQPART